MGTLLETLRQRWNWRNKSKAQPSRAVRTRQVEAPIVDIAPNDPLVAYFLSTSGAVEVDKLNLNSPALQALKAANVKLAVPLISQGELVGLLILGPRLSEQEYSADDRGLLNTLAIQVAPAVRVAQMVREQQAAIRERERLDQELRVARLIQQTLLPKDLPTFPGWQLASYYQAAREVGGDFYDFLLFEDGRLGIVIGDVSGKGVPAAMVMASTRSILRSAAQGEASPGQVLKQVNNQLCPDIAPMMFVTCLYAILDPKSGRLQYANAGHDLPYRQRNGDVSKLRATGMPLGLMPDMRYEEKETTLAHGESIIFFSDGLVEAHNPQREMLGFPRLMSLLKEYKGATTLIDFLLGELAAFTGPDWEQEDDVTIVTLQRLGGYGVSSIASVSATRLDNVILEPEQCHPERSEPLALSRSPRAEGEGEANGEGPSNVILSAVSRSPEVTKGKDLRRGSEAQTVEKTDQEGKGGGDMDDKANEADKTNWKILREWTLPSKPGNERLAMEQVVEAVQLLKLPARRIEQLKTAVAEATMNAMEHGNHYLPDRPVAILVRASEKILSVSIKDHGGTHKLSAEPAEPNLEAKLANLQTPRGWGLFLIKNMVDDVRISSDDSHHTLELIMYLEWEKENHVS